MATKSVSAPSSRVYTSAPRRRQARFAAPPYKVVRDPASYTRVRRDNRKQQTLTQLDFETSHCRDAETCDQLLKSDSEEDEEDQDEWQSDRPAKRRRHHQDKGKARATRDQKTLTQMGALLRFVQESEQDETMTDFGQDPNFIIHQDSWNNPFGSTEADDKKCAVASQFTHCDDSQPSSSKSPFKTPIQQRRTVVPSSQTPSDDDVFDLDDDDMAVDREVSPSPMRRAPLQELPASVVQQRDSSPALLSKPSTPQPASDEAKDDDATDENVMPGSSEWNVKMGKAMGSKGSPSHGQPESSATASARSMQRVRSMSSETANTTPASTQPSTPFKKPLLPARLSSSGSERVQAWPHSPSPLRESFASRLDSQLMAELTPGKSWSVPSLNETADIITASQLLASSDPDEL